MFRKPLPPVQQPFIRPSLQDKYSQYYEVSNHTLSLYLRGYDMETTDNFPKLLQVVNKKLRITSKIRSLSVKCSTDLPLRFIKKITYLVKNLKHLKNFTFIFDSEEDDLPLRLREVRNILKAAKGLQVFELRLFLWDRRGAPSEPIKVLASFLDQLSYIAPNLQTFRLNLHQNLIPIIAEQLSPNFLHRIVRGLWGLKTLELYLHIRFLLDDTKKSLDLSPLQRLKKLEGLSIIFKEDANLALVDTDSEYHLPKLRNLKISLENIFTTSAHTILSMTSRMSACLPNLESLALALTYSQKYVCHRDLDLTVPLPLPIKNLTSLSLALFDSVLSPETILYFQNLLLHPDLISLQSLSLYLNCEFLSDSLLKTVSEDIIQNLVNLRRLSLTLTLPSPGGTIQKVFSPFLPTKGLTNKGLAQLGSLLVKGDTNLQDIHLMIGNCDEIRTKGARELCDKIVEMRNVKRASLVFYGCRVKDEIEGYSKEKCQYLKKKTFKTKKEKSLALGEYYSEFFGFPWH